MQEADVREKEEQEKGKFLNEREEQESKTRVTKRAQDLLINLLALMDGKRHSSGAYWLDVGE